MSIHAPETFRTASPLGDDRLHPRRGLYLPVVLHPTGSHSVGARLADVSERGCRILAPVRVRAGANVILEIPDFSRFEGRVMWQTRQGCGIDFSPPISRSEVAYILSLAAAGA